MFARLFVPLEFGAAVRPDDTFEPVVVEREGYRFEVHPPYKSGMSAGDTDFTSDVPAMELMEKLLPVDDPALRVSLDDRPATVADAIYVDVFGALSRVAGPGMGEDQEVMVPLAIGVVNEVIGRLRAITYGAHVVDVPPDARHVLMYLDDSGEPFETDSSGRLVRQRFKAQFRLPALLLLTPELWNASRELPPDFVNPPWESLLLEAHRLLTDIGPPLVLAYSAVEIRLDNALESLANLSGAAASDLVRWIMETRSPSVPVQASELLPLLGAESLKSDNDLWARFQRLRKARNAFVHDGHAEIDGNTVSSGDMGDLLSTARDVLDWTDRQVGYERPRYAGKSNLGVAFPFGGLLALPTTS